jgi:hypothetical protein
MTVTVVCDPADVTSVTALRAYVVAALGMGAQSDGTPLRFRAVPEAAASLEAAVAANTTAIADLACVPTLAYAVSLRSLIIEWNIPPADNLSMTPADWVVTVNGSAKTTFGVACEDGKVSLELTDDAFYPQSRLPEGSYSIKVAYDGTDATFVDQVGSGRQIAAFTAAASKAAFPRFDLAVFTGDSGSGGLTGLVPAPAAGDAAAGKYLDADGTWSAPSGSSLPDCLPMAYWLASTTVAVIKFNMALTEAALDPAAFAAADATVGGLTVTGAQVLAAPLNHMVAVEWSETLDPSASAVFLGYTATATDDLLDEFGRTVPDFNEGGAFAVALSAVSLPAIYLAVQEVARSYTAITTGTTLDATHELVNCTSGTFAVTLPTAVGFTRQYTIKNSGSGTITLNTTGGETIDGNASGALTLAQWDSITLRSDGANWIIV